MIQRLATFAYRRLQKKKKKPNANAVQILPCPYILDEM